MRNNFAKVLLPLGLLSYTQSLYAEGGETKRPNVLFILVDDLGWNDLSCMGSRYYETPNVDNIARQGVLFTNAYAACQVSSPSRASIMTGKYPTNHGITDWIGEASGEDWRKEKRASKMLPAEYKWSLSHEEYTLAELLRDNGYTTFMAGKWHLGDEGSYPEDHGFMINKGGWSSGGPKGGYFSPFNNPKLDDKIDGENLSMRLANETVDFITEHNKKDSDKPFFAYLSFYAVHGPIQTTEEKWDYFQNKAHKMGVAESGFVVDRTLPVRTAQDNPVYAGLVQHMDDAVGVVLKALKEQGLDENTLVIFTSDNGGVVSGDAYSTCLAPLRGGKGRQWEGGIRVPLLVKYPNMKSVNTTCDEPVSGIDYYATIADYVGVKTDKKHKVDGVSILPALEGESLEDRSLYWHYPHYGNQGGEPSSIIRDGDWKLIYYHEDSKVELYNLAMDISEYSHLNHLYPAKVDELKKKLLKWLKDTKAIMPEADSEYSAIEENKVKQRWATTLLYQQEKSRKDMLNPNWKPNKNWWGSMITID